MRWRTTSSIWQLARGTPRCSALGISPRAGLGLLRATRVWAAAAGRDYVTPDDVKDLAVPVLAHRVVVPEPMVDSAA